MSDDLTAAETVEHYRDWLSRNGRYRCKCGEPLANHYADLTSCPTNIECQGFDLDRDPLVNWFPKE